MNFMSNFFILLLLIKFQFNICGYLFVSKISFLSYSFVMFRIDFLLSIWVNLHIYIDFFFFCGFGFWIEISNKHFILYMADEASLFFGEISKLQPMSSSPRNGKFLFGIYIYIYIYNFFEFEGFCLVLK